MQQINIDLDHQETLAPRTIELFGESRQKHFRQFDRLFIRLMIIQWLVAIGFALWLSPKTWIGQQSQTHLHVWAAIFLGSAISFFPIFLALLRPGVPMTRYTIAVAQMLMSSLLIHLTGGRI